MIADWMGKYPRKGADWSPEEDTALWNHYRLWDSFAELAARHLREPIAIERRLALLRDHQKIKDQLNYSFKYPHPLDAYR